MPVRHPLSVFALSASLALASTGAYSQNWVGLLKNTAAERFDEEDLQLFLQASRKALNEAAVNEPVSWSNPKTYAHGDITVLRSFEAKGLPCKEVRIRNEAGGRKGDGTLDLCKVGEKWKLVSKSQLKGK